MPIRRSTIPPPRPRLLPDLALATAPSSPRSSAADRVPEGPDGAPPLDRVLSYDDWIGGAVWISSRHGIPAES